MIKQKEDEEMKTVYSFTADVGQRKKKSSSTDAYFANENSNSTLKYIMQIRVPV